MRPVAELPDRDDRTPGGGEPEARLWFAKKPTGIGFGPVSWQGRAATFLYVFLVLVAVVTYSQLTLTVFVIGFYTVVFVLVVTIKSDLMTGWPPGS